MLTVSDYIKSKWKDTIHSPDEKSRGIVRMPLPYSVPCAHITDMFSDFYYWDTYFANLGLMRDGYTEQAKNNLSVMAFFVENMGFIPNSNHLLDRSQPPLFTRGVYDFIQFTGDRKIVKDFLPFLISEHRFFMADRMTRTGLNQYGQNCLDSVMLESYPILADRVGEERETNEEKLELTRDLMTIAESGWDFTPRFNTGERRFAAREFIHLDLNCLLYDMEIKIAEMAKWAGDYSTEKEYDNFAQNRKTLMERYMCCSKDGIFYDYNFVKQEFSSVVSAASFYPFAVGLSHDQKAVKEVLCRLELDHGLATCEYRGEKEKYLQWDYPSMWPSNVYFAYVALMNTGLETDAKRIAEKYIHTVESVFQSTGGLWEKYNASDASVAITDEYETPQMMGWTAGVFEYLHSELNK